MPSLLDSLQNLFGTRDLYEVLDLTKDANEAQIRKAYHKVINLSKIMQFWLFFFTFLNDFDFSLRKTYSNSSNSQ